jgi:putative ABC transport system permease protein
MLAHLLHFGRPVCMNDLRFALRQLMKHPGFTALAVITLALGIGANTAIFSLVNGVLLKPLPFREPERLVRVFDAVPSRGALRIPASLPNYVDWRAQNTVFEAMAVYGHVGFNLTGDGEARRITGLRVSAEMLPVLGISPRIGRAFTTDDEKTGAPRVVLLGDSLWRTRFGADPAVLGRSVQMDGQGYMVAGVLPAGFRYPDREADFWVPAAFSPEELRDRGAHTYGVLARLKQGIGIAQAAAEMNTIAGRIAAEHESNRDFAAAVVGLHEDLVGTSRRPLWVLLGAVACVLLIACANVANLQLARASSRQREFAVRGALGAGRAQMIRQLLVESVMLAGAGGLLGVLLARWAVSLFIAFGPRDIPRLNEIQISVPVLLFSLGVSVVTGLIFGLAPALQAAKADVNEVLKDSGRGTTDGFRRNRLRGALVMSEVALSLVLLAGAGLLLRSFAKMREVDIGFQPSGLLTANLAVSEQKYPDEPRQVALILQVVERARALPGVQSASAVFGLPLDEMVSRSMLRVEGRPAPAPNEADSALYRQITPGYFKTMGTSLIAGRDVTSRDTADAPLVVVVNEAFVRAFFPGLDTPAALGRRIHVNSPANVFTEIVGVVRDMRYRGPAEPAEPEMYLPVSQRCWGFVSVVLRTSGDPSALSDPLRKAIAEIDPAQPLDNVRPMATLLADTLSTRKLQTALLGAFSTLALVLAAVGIYGVMAWSVSRRGHEIGIRMALGAQWRDVVRLVLRQGMIPAVAGVGIGLAAGLGLARFLAGLLFEVKPNDPPTFGAVTALLIGVALLACWLPARRAARVGPMVALRNE